MPEPIAIIFGPLLVPFAGTPTPLGASPIARGASQRGVPYSWGGGAINGPRAGVEEDAGKIGFDCSGFTRYAFAGVGVQIPKYSGDQYNAGRHILT